MQAVQLASSEDALLEPYTPTDDERTQACHVSICRRIRTRRSTCIFSCLHTHVNVHTHMLMDLLARAQKHASCTAFLFPTPMFTHIHAQAVVAEANARLQGTKQKPQESRIAALQRATVLPTAAGTVSATEHEPVANRLVATQKPLAPALDSEQVAPPAPEAPLHTKVEEGQPAPRAPFSTEVEAIQPAPEVPLPIEVEEVKPAPEAPLATKVEEVQPEWIMKMRASKDCERRKVIHFSDTGGQPVFEALHAVFQSPVGSAPV